MKVPFQKQAKKFNMQSKEVKSIIADLALLDVVEETHGIKCVFKANGNFERIEVVDWNPFNSLLTVQTLESVLTDLVKACQYKVHVVSAEKFSVLAN